MSDEYTPPREPCKRADGMTKFGYDTHAKAKKAARRTNVNGPRNGHKVHPYRCPECDYYHVGYATPGRPRNPGARP